MAVTQRLEVRQAQSLVMTPQLQQAIKLLQMSNIELSEFVEQEIEQNPLLEPDDRDDSANDGTEALQSPDVEPGGEIRVESADAAPEPRDTSELTGSEQLPNAAESPLDTDYDGVYDNAPVDDWGHDPNRLATSSSSGAAAPDDQLPERQLSETITLRHHVLEQMQVDIRDPAERLIAVHLTDMLDVMGYLRGDLNELADQLGCHPTLVERCLAKLQSFDPAGIFARDLKECLKLQLIDRNRFDPAMAALLGNLGLLARGEKEKLKGLCQVDDEDLVEMIAEIKALDPKPALGFETIPAETLIPDILMRPLRAGGWFIELNPETLPKVLVNNSYYASISKRLTSKDDKEYLTEQLQSANWLVRSLHQRATTILKTATEIVRRQDAFFLKGIQYLRPLTLKDIAEAIEMHESTISRVTSNKYIATPRGILELKYFFTTAISGSGGSEHSAEAVRYRIKRMIDDEAPDRILSDDMIVELLQRDGVEIARRTVAKYRVSMQIPSSVARRRAKASA